MNDCAVFDRRFLNRIISLIPIKNEFAVNGINNNSRYSTLVGTSTYTQTYGKGINEIGIVTVGSCKGYLELELEGGGI